MSNRVTVVVPHDMSPRQALHTLAVAFLLAIAISLLWLNGGFIADEGKPKSFQQTLDIKETDKTVWGAVWSFRPDGVEQITDKAQAIVEAKVVSVQSGPDIVSPEPNGNVIIPTQRIKFGTLRKLSDSAPGEFILFKTGSIHEHIEDDPPYNEGEKYVLFISPRGEGDGTYLPVGPDGRLREGSDGRVEPEIEGPVGDELNDMTVDQIEWRIKKKTKKLTLSKPGVNDMSTSVKTPLEALPYINIKEFHGRTVVVKYVGAAKWNQFIRRRK